MQGAAANFRNLPQSRQTNSSETISFRTICWWILFWFVNWILPLKYIYLYRLYRDEIIGIRFFEFVRDLNLLIVFALYFLFPSPVFDLILFPCVLIAFCQIMISAFKFFLSLLSMEDDN
jgi:hypothetical protein